MKFFDTINASSYDNGFNVKGIHLVTDDLAVTLTVKLDDEQVQRGDIHEAIALAVQKLEGHAALVRAAINYIEGNTTAKAVEEFKAALKVNGVKL